MKKSKHEDISKKLGKLTIKEPYTKTRWLSIRVRAYIDLLRAFTLFAPFVVSMAIIVASLIIRYYQGHPIPENWLLTVGHASTTILIVNAASNALNQATDVEADIISKPYRPIPRKIIRPDEAQSLALVLYLFALLRSTTINALFGFFIFLIMIFTVTYSLPPRMKKYLLINQIWIAVPRGLLGILASWSVFGADNLLETPTPWIIGGVATVFLIGGMSTKDIVDREADRRTGTRTLINTFGIKKTALFSFPFMFFPFIFISIFINRGLLESYLWPLILLAIPSIVILFLMIKPHESETLENVPAWSIMYMQYISFALIFAFLTIFNDILPF